MNHTEHPNDAEHTETHGQQASGHSGHGGHGWMMIACCIPMLVIAVVLVVTGVASASFLFAALACTVMMALMMRGMSSSDHTHG